MSITSFAWIPGAVGVLEALGDTSLRILTVAALLVATLVLAQILGVLLRRLLQRLARANAVEADDIVVAHCSWPLRVLLASVLFWIELSVFAGAVQVVPELAAILRHCISIAIILGVTWFLIAIVQVLEAMIVRRYDVGVEDNLEARRIVTQVRVIKRVVVLVLLVIGGASFLMTFERVRELGASLLASAGIAGVILGIAAQRSLATIIAGLQIALTQPIRIDDVVIVEGEWGQIEEITLTYVVVRIWDQRRLIVPITQFIERPFQNWTRVNSEILGTVFIHADYKVPVDELRAELQRIVADSELWDHRLCKLQVTNATEQTLELRALVSARDASKAWDLRCLVRERLIDFLRTKHPESLPRTRVALDSGQG